MKRISEQQLNEVQPASSGSKLSRTDRYLDNMNMRDTFRGSLRQWGTQNQAQTQTKIKPASKQPTVRTLKYLKINEPTNEPAISNRYPSFCMLIPTVLFSIVTKIYVLYFLAVGALLFFQFRSNDIVSLAIHLGLLGFLIILEFFLKYLTYLSLCKARFSQKQYQVYRNSQWVSVKDNQIMVGDIIKVLKHQRNPVKLLPLKVHSKKQEINIDTFVLNKKERIKKIAIFPYFSRIFKDKDDALFLSQIDANFIIQYTQISSIGSFFKAKIKFPNYAKQASFDDKFTIPPGVTIDTERFVVGVALFDLEISDREKIVELFYQRRITQQILTSFILKTLIIDLVVAAIVIIINAILIAASSTRTNIKEQSYRNLGYLTINVLTLLSQSVNIVMYVFHSLYRALASIRARNATNVKIYNYQKSIEQFGMVNTVLLDDYAFLKRQLLQVKQIQIKQQKSLDQADLLQIIADSELFRTTFYKFWLPLVQRRVRMSMAQNRQSFTIQKSTKLRKGQIQLDIKHDDYSFFLIISENQNWQSKLQSMGNSKQVGKNNREGQMLLVKIAIQRGSRKGMMNSNNIEISDGQEQIPLAKSERGTVVHSIIKFDYNRNNQASSFMKQIKKDCNVIILSARPWQVLEGLLTSAEIKKGYDQILTFEQKDLEDFKIQLENKLVDLQMKRIQCDGQLIVVLDYQQIAFLYRQSIRAYIRKLSQFCKYFIFLNCNQHQKELCAANIVKIFPYNLFITGFKCDQNICRWSYLNISLSPTADNPFITIRSQNFQGITNFFLKQGQAAAQGLSFILKSKIFQNTVLIYTLILSFFFVYRGKMNSIGSQYSQQLILFYNLFFTVLPLIYYLLAKPMWYNCLSDVQTAINDRSLLYQYIKGMIIGIFIAFFMYAFSAVEYTNNIFFMIIINVTIASNIYYLSIDGSISKIWQSFIILVQIGFIVGLLIGLKLGQRFGYQFITIQLNLSSRNIFMYVGCFLIGPFQSILMLFTFSIIKGTATRKIRPKKRNNQNSHDTSPSNDEQRSSSILKLQKKHFQTLRFRRDFKNTNQLYRMHRDMNQNYTPSKLKKKHSN